MQSSMQRLLITTIRPTHQYGCNPIHGRTEAESAECSATILRTSLGGLQLHTSPSKSATTKGSIERYIQKKRKEKVISRGTGR